MEVHITSHMAKLLKVAIRRSTDQWLISLLFELFLFRPRAHGALMKVPQLGTFLPVCIQGDKEELKKPPVDLVPTVPAAGGPLL